MADNFQTAFIAHYKNSLNPLCVGLDPHYQLIPEFFFPRDRNTLNSEEASKVISEFLQEVISIVSQFCFVVKPQAAFFEQHGHFGMKCLSDIAQYAKDEKLLVILDAKRGDIGSTAKAYANAYLSSDSPYDALTINPYMGMDTIEPFLDTAQSNNKGLFVLVKTSNQGSSDIQNMEHNGDPVYVSVAKKLNDLYKGNEDWSPLGAVVGATYPNESELVRKELPRSIFLIPGYGAQGGTAAQAITGFKRDSEGILTGGIINSSRGILFPSATYNDYAGWKSAVKAAAARASTELSTAVRKAS